MRLRLKFDYDSNCEPEYGSNFTSVVCATRVLCLLNSLFVPSLPSIDVPFVNSFNKQKLSWNMNPLKGIEQYENQAYKTKNCRQT